jgi:hypothetical protein
MLDPAKIHLAIGTPCFDGYTHEYVSSMLPLVGAFARDGVALSWILHPRCPLVHVSRNLISAIFLSRPELTHLLWIDADIGFTTEGVCRLIKSGHELVGGDCPLKTLKRNPRAWNVKAASGAQVSDGGFIEAEVVGTGFLMLRRSVFEKMIAAHPELKRVADPTFPDYQKVQPHYYGFFDMIVEPNGRQLGEDVSFCKRWRDIGGKIYCDRQSELTHTGTHVFI